MTILDSGSIFVAGGCKWCKRCKWGASGCQWCKVGKTCFLYNK
jgi:hypothetical protein